MTKIADTCFSPKWFSCTIWTSSSIVAFMVFSTLYLFTHTQESMGFSCGTFGAFIMCLLWILNDKNKESY